MPMIKLAFHDGNLRNRRGIYYIYTPELCRTRRLFLSLMGPASAQSEKEPSDAATSEDWQDEKTKVILMVLTVARLRS